MARFVRFDDEAELRFKALVPAALRRQVADRVASIAITPSPIEAEDFRLVAWGSSPNTGLVLSLVLYRIVSEANEVWIQDVIMVRGEGGE